MKISYSLIKSECDELHALANKINETVDSIKTLNNSLQSSDLWTGNASDYFSEKLAKILENFGDISNEIENSVLYLANITEGYAVVDKMVLSQICNKLNISEPNLNASAIFHETTNSIK